MGRTIPKCISWFFAALVAVPAFAQTPSSNTETPELVWTWSKQCSRTNRLGVTVSLDRKILYRGALPICRGSRDAEDGRVQFHFSGHTFPGGHRTHSTDLIEGAIWQAGGEKDAMILGISFHDNNQILLNTLHIARPWKQTSSDLGKGLSITTYPALLDK